MATIHAATGPIDTADLGFTLMHEHIRVGWPPMYHQYPEMWDRQHQLDRAVSALNTAKEAGIRSIVDLTPIDLGRDASLIADASRASGVNIIVATGIYYTPYPFHFLFRPDTEMTALFVKDITEGISTTGVRAGVIKCATEPEMHPVNERVLRSAARAAKETGVPICTHTYPENRTGLDQQRVFKEEGLDLSRTVIGHSDDSHDITYLEQIIENGSYCGMDRIGLQNPRTSEQRADMIAALVEKGYANRITLSHDASPNFHWAPDGALAGMTTWQWTHIPNDVIPMLRQRGVSEANITQMTTGNPRAVFGG